MTLQEAFKIGTRAEGYVKCTFVEIIQPDTAVKFAIQRTFGEESQARKDFEEKIGSTAYGDSPVVLTIDLPIVKCEDPSEIIVAGKPYVQCKLTDEARAFMYKCIKHKTNARRRELQEVLDQDGAVWVKPIAVDWTPTDIKNIVVEDENGKQISLTDARQKAYNELQAAKALLAGSAVYAFM